eukprot:jgi/Botrbrau1/10956/Bobra.0383s0011.1
MPKSVARRLADAKQRALGRQPLRFQLELVPLCVEDIPSGVTNASFLWQRGPKLQFTDATAVSETGRTAYWNQVLKQTATFYKDGNTFLPKESTFKVQTVRGKHGEKRDTFAKCKVDLAQFCSCEATGSKELVLPLRPQGRLRLSILPCWLRHSSPETDGLTELSGLSFGVSVNSSGGSGSCSLEEQDLSGFDDTSSRIEVRSSPLKKRSLASARSFPVASSISEEVDEGEDSKRDLIPAGPAMPKRATTLPTALPFQSSLGLLTPLNQFSGFPVPQVEAVTPTAMPSRNLGEGPSHKRTFSEPGLATRSHDSIREATPISPREDFSKVVQESYAMLVTSDSEDEEPVGLIASVRRTFGNLASSTTKSIRDRAYKRQDLGTPPLLVNGLRCTPEQALFMQQELDNVDRESDINVLRELCKQLLQSRDAERAAKLEFERQVARLQAEVDQVTRAKAMMVDRLSVAEDRLMALSHQDTMEDLVQAKLRLAQADYLLLEKQGELNQEKAKTRVLRNRLTNLEAEYFAVLDQLQPTAPGTPDQSEAAAAAEKGLIDATLEACAANNVAARSSGMIVLRIRVMGSQRDFT